MDMNTIFQVGSQLFSKSLDTNNDGALDMGDASQLLSSLIGDKENAQINLANLQERAQSSGLGSLFSSWLGDGENLPISMEQVKSLIDEQKINDLASQFGLSPTNIVSGLQEALPAMIDKASKGGSFMEDIQTMIFESDGLKKLFS